MLAARVEPKNGTEESSEEDAWRKPSRGVKAPTPNLGRPAQAGAVPVDGASSAVELALVMADAE
jgi:hypothetical protein